MRPPAALLPATALTALSGAAFAAVFPLADVAVPLTLAALIPVGLALAARARARPHLAAVALLDLAALALVVASTTARSTAVGGFLPTLDTAKVVAQGITGGWADIASAAVPAPATPSSLVVAVVAVWLASFTVTELAFRTRSATGLVIPPVLVAVLAIALSGGSSGTWGWWVVAWVALAMTTLLLASLARQGDGRGAGRQRAAAGAAFVVVAAIAGLTVTAVGPFTEAGDQFLIRDVYAAPIDDRPSLSPLVEVARAGGDEPHLTVTFDQPMAAGTTLRAVALDGYDEITWSSIGAYRLTGGSVPAPDRPEGPITRVRQHIELDHPAEWLPTLERPAELAWSDLPLGIEVNSGNLLLAGGAPAGFTYDVTSLVPKVEVADLAGAGVATTEAARVATSAFPHLPVAMADLLALIRDKAASPFQQLALLAAFFQNNEVVNDGPPFTERAEAAPDFSLAGIEQLISRDGDRAARPEQYAAAFAILARAVGFPTRVVVGYRLPVGADAGRPVTLGGADLAAWPEVALAGFGWVPFNPTPGAKGDAKLSVAERELESAISDAVTQTATPPAVAPPVTSNPPGADAGPGSNWWVRLGVGLAVGVSLVGVGVALLRWRRGTRGRGDPDPGRRIVAAWRQVVGRLPGPGDPETWTARDAERVARERLDDATAEVVAELGGLLNEALHAPRPPDRHKAEAAWSLVDPFKMAARRARAERRARHRRREVALTDAGGTS